MSPELLSGFIGAAFAFLFVRLTDLLTRYYERSNKHHAALVRLERMAGDQMVSITRSLHEIEGVAKTYQAMGEEGVLSVVVNEPEDIPIDNSIEYELTNIDLVNDLATHRGTVMALNRDLARLTGISRELRSGLIEKRIQPDVYVANLAALVDASQVVHRHLQACREDAETLGAKARVRARLDAPLFNRAMRYVRRSHYEATFQAKVAMERARMEGERKQLLDADRKRIEKIATRPRMTNGESPSGVADKDSGC